MKVVRTGEGLDGVWFFERVVDDGVVAVGVFLVLFRELYFRVFY